MKRLLVLLGIFSLVFMVCDGNKNQDCSEEINQTIQEQQKICEERINKVHRDHEAILAEHKEKWRKEKEGFKAEIKKLKSAIEFKNNRINKLLDRVKKLENEIEDLKEKISDKNSTIQSLENRIELLKAEIEKLESEVQEWKQKYEDCINKPKPEPKIETEWKTGRVFKVDIGPPSHQHNENKVKSLNVYLNDNIYIRYGASWNYIPVWVNRKHNLAICPEWVENAPYESILTDARYMNPNHRLNTKDDYLRITEESRSDNHITINYAHYIANGKDIYLGDAYAELRDTYYKSGIAEREIYINKSRAMFEIWENLIIDLESLHIMQKWGRNGKIVEFLNPWANEKIILTWKSHGRNNKPSDEFRDKIKVSCSGDWRQERKRIASWSGVIVRTFSKYPDAGFFTIFGKKRAPHGMNIQPWNVRSITMRPYVAEWSANNGTATTAPVIDARFFGKFSGGRTWKILMGMGEYSNSQLKRIARDWLETGKIPK